MLSIATHGRTTAAVQLQPPTSFPPRRGGAGVSRERPEEVLWRAACPSLGSTSFVRLEDRFISFGARRVRRCNSHHVR